MGVRADRIQRITWLYRALLCALYLPLWPSAAFAQDTLARTCREAAARTRARRRALREARG